MPGLPSSLLKKLNRTLLACDPFNSHEDLVNVFNDQRIASWKNDVPNANTKKDLVSRFVGKFIERENLNRQNVLVLFLHALHDKIEEDDDIRNPQLHDLAIEVAYVLGSPLPPLARNNLLRAGAVLAGETLPEELAGYYAPPPAEAEAATQVETLPSGLPAQRFTEHLESLKHKQKADWLPISFLERGVQASQAVGRVDYQGRNFGTAFLVAPNLVMTNAHVIQSLPGLTQAGVRFNVGLQAQWHYFTKVVEHSPVEGLDFALVELATPAQGSPLALSAESAYPGQAANILQFPGVAGGLMQVALRFNAVVHAEAKRVYYVADTDEGSSGSPVFNDDWQVIALHRAGMVDEAKRPVKNANQGVPVRAIEPIIHRYLAGG